MNRTKHLVIQLYRLLLNGYPSTFRAKFGEEMQEVFRTSLEAGSPWRLLWQELRHWPWAALQAHMQAKRKRMKSNGFYRLPRLELLAAMIIFILPLFSLLAITGIDLPGWTTPLQLVAMWGSVLFALGLAIVKKMPGWSLSYLGFVLMFGLIFSPLLPRLSEWVYPYFLEVFGLRSQWPISVSILYAGIFEFIGALQILLAALALVSLLRLWPYTRAVWEHMRADWTQLSFMIYGGLVFVIILVFEEYRYDDWWKFAAWTFLAAGAWSYLRARKEKARIVSLSLGTTAAFWTVALAKWILIPLQLWPTGYPDAPTLITRWAETGNTLLSWLFILGILYAPVLMKRLPPLPGPTSIEEERTANSRTA